MQLDENKYLTLKMSESIVKEEFGTNFVQPTSLYNIVNINNSNKVVEMKHNENGAKPEDGSYLHDVFQNSTYGKYEIKVKTEIEGNNEPIQIQDDKIKCKIELEIKEGSIASTEENYQCMQVDEAFPHNNTMAKHKRTNTGKNSYHCN
ncbi:unnamed protein product, partial [Meganyctiphanes norvegica]